MSTEANKVVILRLFNEAIAERKFELFDEIIAAKFINHSMPNAGSGPQGFKAIITQFVNSFPDMKIHVESTVAEKDVVATRGFWTGTHQNEFMGIPGTGRKVRIEYVDFWKLQNGKCIENWVQMDMAGLMQQIAAMETAL